MALERETTSTLLSVTGKLVRDGVEITLDPFEIALVRALNDALAQDANRAEAVRGFVRSVGLTHLVPMSPSPDHALATIRHLVKRLERKLGALGEPNVLETCERRGYRLREIVTLTR
jgi:DNA-binding response OmpR family regulator